MKHRDPERVSHLELEVENLEARIATWGLPGLSGTVSIGISLSGGGGC